MTFMGPVSLRWMSSNGSKIPHLFNIGVNFHKNTWVTKAHEYHEEPYVVLVQVQKRVNFKRSCNIANVISP